MTVYVVTAGEYDQYDIKAVFETEALADSFVATVKAQKGNRWTSYADIVVQPWTVHTEMPDEDEVSLVGWGYND